MIQELIAFGILGVALLYLGRKFFYKKKKNNDNCGTDCGCG
ncbi:FeoB-associated Cys-rich membrane protein [Flavobacterium selenitireducens]|nr:FeoB-associated Cys-rich membrane protein [Flavobacterium selenitireducens]MBD3581683.1 FeoB-associated Cys-rich membrane protein [Flavobacterium selenitireducens]